MVGVPGWPELRLIFEPVAIGCGEDEPAVRVDEAVQSAEEQAWILDVLDDVDAEHKVWSPRTERLPNRLLAQVRGDPLAAGVLAAGHCDRVRLIDSDRVHREPGEVTGEIRPGTASDVEHDRHWGQGDPGGEVVDGVLIPARAA